MNGFTVFPAIAQAMYGIYRTQTIHCISVFNGINFALKRSRFLNYASFQTSVRNIPNNTSAIARDASQKHLLYRLPSHWLAIWRIFRRSPLSEEKYPNRNPAWKQALLIIDFQWFTKKGSSTSLSASPGSCFFDSLVHNILN